ncbi:MAG: DNA-3-methyladenine glycosylase I [Clostridiales Family XIII bacterium]|jgi:DNA-3-methyladenine glycosylase I|nr:DNA-3-methyladenine glycosylase I [Clostridiales Family XIII bacterium]
MTDNKIRCPWGDTDDALMRAYHDNEWGKPCRDERKLFELLTLEGAQAGLSWATVLHKRENYRSAFDDWDIAKIAVYSEDKISELLANPGIIRNRLKIRSVVTNAQATLKLGSLAEFIWAYAPPCATSRAGTPVDGKPIVNHWERQEEMPAKTELSDRISRDMKKLGFKFVGSTIIYSFLQAIGIVNDHIVTCEFIR